MSTQVPPAAKPPPKQARREIRILIIAKNVSNFQKAAQFLTRRGWPSDVVGNVKQAVEYVVKHRPMFVMVSFSHPNANVTKLPNLLTQTFKATCIAFGENTDPKTTARLHGCRLKHIFYGVLSGPSIHMRIKKILIDMENEMRKAQQPKEGAHAPGPTSADAAAGPSTETPGQVIMKGRNLGPRQAMVLGQPGAPQKERGFHQTPSSTEGGQPEDQELFDDSTPVEEGESYWGKKKYGQGAEADYMDYQGAKESSREGAEEAEGMYGQDHAQGYAPGLEQGMPEEHFSGEDAALIADGEDGDYAGEDADFDAQAFLEMAAQHGADPSTWPEADTADAIPDISSLTSQFEDEAETFADPEAESFDPSGATDSGSGYQPRQTASNMAGNFYNPQRTSSVQGPAGAAQHGHQAKGHFPQNGGSATGERGPGFYNPQESQWPAGEHAGRQSHPQHPAGGLPGQGETAPGVSVESHRTTDSTSGFAPGQPPTGEAETRGAEVHSPSVGMAELSPSTAHVRSPELAGIADVFGRGLKNACEPLMTQPRKIGDLETVGVMTVVSPSTSGYLLFAVPKGTGVGAGLIQKIQSCVQSEMESQRMDFRLTDQFETQIEKVSFVSWAQTEADFMSVHQHQDFELAIAFFAVPNVPRLRPSEDVENMSVVDLSSVIPDIPVQFRGYINFKKNDKMILYVKSGRSISQEQKSRLMQKNVNELFIPDAEAGIFIAQMAQAMINQKIQSYLSQKVLRRAS